MGVPLEDVGRGEPGHRGPETSFANTRPTGRQGRVLPPIPRLSVAARRRPARRRGAARGRARCRARAALHYRLLRRRTPAGAPPPAAVPADEFQAVSLAIGDDAETLAVRAVREQGAMVLANAQGQVAVRLGGTALLGEKLHLGPLSHRPAFAGLQQLGLLGQGLDGCAVPGGLMSALMAKPTPRASRSAIKVCPYRALSPRAAAWTRPAPG